MFLFKHKTNTKITTMSSKKNWALVTLIIFVPIYIMALYLVIEGVEDSLEPFIMLNIGALSIPYFIKELFSKEESAKRAKQKEERGKFWRLLSIFTTLSAAITGAIWLLGYTHGVHNTIDTLSYIGIFVGTLCVFFIIYFFLWFLPRKMELDD